MSFKYASCLLLVVAIAVCVTGCIRECGSQDEALQSITEKDLASDIQILASDDFEGRAPSSHGEKVTIDFMREEFKKLGLEPGNGHSYFQEIELVEITASPDAELAVSGGGSRSCS